MCYSSLLITCPCQFSRLSVIFLEACATLVVVPRMCSFLVIPLCVTPHIHRSIIVWICVGVMKVKDGQLVACINLLFRCVGLSRIVVNMSLTQK